MKKEQLELAIRNQFPGLLSKVTVISKLGEPLKVRFIASDVPIMYNADQPSTSAAYLQVFNPKGKQLGTVSRIRIEWYSANLSTNVAEIERVMLKSDFPEGTEFPNKIYDTDLKKEPELVFEETMKSLRSIYTIPEDLEDTK